VGGGWGGGGADDEQARLELNDGLANQVNFRSRKAESHSTTRALQIAAELKFKKRTCLEALLEDLGQRVRGHCAITTGPRPRPHLMLHDSHAQ
jgi:hypothetical protein